MGSKRVGLARTQTLIQNLKRAVDWNGATLNDVIITSNRAIAVSGSGGALQSLGAYSYHGESAASYGVYRCAYEVDFSGSQPTNTLSGLVKTVATIPTGAKILNGGVIVSEAFVGSNDNAWSGSLDFVVGFSSTSPSARNDVMTMTLGLMTGAAGNSPASARTNTEFNSNAAPLGMCRVASASAATSTFVGNAGAGVNLVVVNTGSANSGSQPDATIKSGKLLVWCEYMGSGAPAVDQTV